MTAAEILAALPGLSVLVVGDLCLDAWCHYDPLLTEPSRETGIPRTAVVRREVTPGAAGTVASNLKALGVGHVHLLSVVGDDGHAFDLLRALAAQGIDGSHVLKDSGRSTFTYTKLINKQTNVEDLPRIDYVPTAALPPALENELIERLTALVNTADVVIVSDQAETDSGGIISMKLRGELSNLAVQYPKKVMWVDSRKRGEHFPGLLVKLNEQEAAECCHRLFHHVDYHALRLHLNHPYLIVTQGAAGATVVTSQGSQHLPGRRVDAPIDICGAGDSFNAGAATALALTCDPAAAARFGNLVASITVMKPGTGAALPEEVLDAGEWFDLNGQW